MSPTPEARERFLAGTAELAIVLRGGSDGFVAETVVASSRPGIEPYRMLRSLGGYWMHADTRCMGFLQYNQCRHVDAAEARENKMSESQELVVYTNPLALAERVTVDAILEDFQAVGEWRYSFENRGQKVDGLSADGVQDGVRQMARKGEAIRTLDVHLERETETDAYFIARAARYAIAPDGREIMLDSTLRGKRVSKQGNAFWFEHGVTKASRNAEEALMPEALKQWMLAQAAQQAGAPNAPRRQAPRPSTPRQSAPPRHVDAETGEIRQGPDFTAFWTELRPWKVGPADVAAHLGIDKDDLASHITTQEQANEIIETFRPKAEQPALA